MLENNEGLGMIARPNEARTMYEKLQSHPNAKVSKRAAQFMFSFQVIVNGMLKKVKNAAQ